VSYPDAPTHTPFGQRLRDRTQALALDDEAYGFAHAYLSEALAQPYREVQEVFDPEGDIPPVAPLLDPDLCPDWALPWLAQLVGLTIPAGTPTDVAREMIRTVSGFARGTPAALRAAAGFFLTGTKTVFFNERLAGDPYRLGVITLASETPDVVRVEAAILAQKPGGIILSYACISGQTYRAVITEVDSYREMRSTWASYRDVRDHLPREIFADG
jgi:hypothetical protein